MSKLYFEDCLVGMQKIPEKSIDLILCDLPYGKTQNKWDKIIDMKKLWEQYHRISRGNIVLFGSGKFTANLIMASPWYRYNLVWQKTNATGFLNANRQPLRGHDDIVVFYKRFKTYNPQKTDGHERKRTERKNNTGGSNYNKCGKNKYDSTVRFPTSVWTFPSDKQTMSLHETQKPLALIKQLVLTYSNVGDIVLDNAAGSGTTPVACIETQRQYIAFENNEDKFNIAFNRINHAIQCADGFAE